MEKRSRGLFVTFEGIDGVGKTTVLAAVAGVLEAEGAEVLRCKLPGDGSAGSDIGAGLRHLLFFDPTTKRMAPGVADLLFLADFVQCSEKTVKPALKRGAVVLCDRYADSQYAYASHPSKGTPPWALHLYKELEDMYGAEPDLTLLLTGDPAAMWARSKARLAEGAKQDGKAWEGAEAQAVIQRAYVDRLGWRDRTKIIEVDHKGPEVLAECLALVRAARGGV